MSWNKEKVIKFIEAYRGKKVLWDPSDKDYYNRNMKQEAWEDIAVEMDCNVEEIKKKMEYLLAALRREKAKMKKYRTTRKGADEVYHSTWFAFNYLQFLMNRNKSRQRINNEGQDRASTESEYDENDQSGPDRDQPQERPSTVNPESKDRTTHNTMNPSQTLKSLRAKKRKHAPPDPMPQSAFDLRQSSALASTAPAELDQYQLYANYLAGKFRGYSKQTYIAVEHQINNLLYNADCGQYDNQSGFYSTSYSIAETGHPQMSVASSNSYREERPAPTMVENQVQIKYSPASEVDRSSPVILDDDDYS